MNNALPFTPSSFSHAPLGPAVITLYDRGRPIYITAVAMGRKWLEVFHHNLSNPANTISGLRAHLARNAEHISFEIEEAATLSTAKVQASVAIARFLPWFNFPRKLRELAGWKIPEPKNREAALNYASEHCLPATVRLLKCLMVRAGLLLDLRKLFRASNSSTMETFVAAWDELVEEGLVEGWERR